MSKEFKFFVLKFLEHDLRFCGAIDYIFRKLAQQFRL